MVDRTGQFEWHDHRIHWMSPVTPPQVKDKSKRTLIFNWQVPIAVGATKGDDRPGSCSGRPRAPRRRSRVIVLGVRDRLGGLLFVLFVRRRRARAAPRRPARAPARERTERPPEGGVVRA